MDKLVLGRNLVPVEQKTVTFNGAELVAVKANDGKIYAGVRWICQGLGFDERKSRAEVERMSRDVVLGKGVQKIGLLTNGGYQEVTCIELDYLPLWLAKINANIIDDPGLQERLIQYQLKAKDVLAVAFVSQITYRLPQSYAEALRELADTVEEKTRLEAKIEQDRPKVEFAERVSSAEGLQDIGTVAKALGWGRNRLFAHLRKMRILMNNNIPLQHYIDSGYFVVREKVIAMGDAEVVKPQTYVTPKGLEFIHRVCKDALPARGFPGHRPGGGKPLTVLRHEFGGRAEQLGGLR